MIHKTTRSILSVLLAALLLVTSVPLTPAFAGGGGAVSPQSESAESEGLTGSGTAGNPYKIATAEQLDEFRKIVEGGDTDASAVLTADIVLNEKIEVDENGTVTNQKELSEWTPIGNSESTAYTGTFDGDGHTIRGLYINSSDNDYKGLFGYVGTGGTVQNLSVSGSVSGHLYVGGIAGRNGGNVINCTNTGSVSGVSTVGGVVGVNRGSVENCYNTGSVTSNDSLVGGVVGHNGGPVKNCYNTGTVSSNIIDLGGVGGVVGYNYSGGSVTSSYNTGEVSGSGLYVGGVVGYNEAGASVTGCYFLQSTAASGIGGNDSAEGAAAVKDLSELCEKFESVTGWETNTILNRPVLTSNHEDDGTQAHPYRISTATQLKNFATAVNGGDTDAHAKLMNNINLSSVCGESNSWNPIGNDAHQYIGTFNGNGKTIENLYINSDTTANNQGLFGYVGSGGIVQNLSVSGSVKGHSSVGGVVGDNNGGTVTGCIFSGSGSVSGVSTVGGVVGVNSGTVENCYNIGEVSGDEGVGGVVGWNGGTVENCYNTGSVSGPDSGTGNRVGGVVGYNSGTVKNCYNTVTVSGSDRVGGVVGYNVVTPQGGGTVENCYNTGNVSVKSSDISNVGGVVGYNDSSSTVTNCYNTGNVSVTSSDISSVSGDWYVGGVVGYNNGGSVTGCYFLQQNGVPAQGIGGGSGDAAAKDDTAFHSGEVAYLLQSKQPAAEDGTIPQVWGQSNLNATTSLPTLNPTDEQKVYQVTFDYGDSFADNDGRFAYSYTNGVVSKPDKNPELAGHTLSGWYSDPSLTTAWTFDTEISNDKILYAKWTPVAEPDPTPTPTPDPTPSGPSTGDSTGWDDILDELENTAKGDQITIDMGDETKVPAEIFESLAGKDVDVTFDLGDIQWSASGADIPTDTDFTDLDLGVNLDTSGIPVNVINTITGEVGTVQITLAHNGEFGFTMTLTAPLGKENAGYWANLYHYDEDAEALNFEATAKIDEDGSVTIPFSHASQYAIVIDTHSHATVDVSDLFIDIARDAWYKDAVQYAYDNGLMTGVSATEFAPEATTTRAMIVSILARLENVTTAEAAGFADVDDEWYATAVNWAAANGVVNGYEDNTFRPNTAITREQLAAILMNYAAYKGEDVSNRADLTSYTDQPSTWAEEAMSWAVAEGLISGVTNTELQPQGNATRAQVAAILQRFLSE